MKYYSYESREGAGFINSMITELAKLGKVDAIQCIFIAPEFLITDEDGALSVDHSNAIKAYRKKLTEKKPITAIRNNKCLTFPYRYILVSNNNGGSAVYAKRIAYKLGAINASNAVVNSLVPHGISNFGYLVRTHCAKDSYVLPYLKDDGGFTSIALVDSSDITIRAYKATWAEATWFFDLYYVKY